MVKKEPPSSTCNILKSVKIEEENDGNPSERTDQPTDKPKSGPTFPIVLHKLHGKCIHSARSITTDHLLRYSKSTSITPELLRFLSNLLVVPRLQCSPPADEQFNRKLIYEARKRGKSLVLDTRSHEIDLIINQYLQKCYGFQVENRLDHVCQSEARHLLNSPPFRQWTTLLGTRFLEWLLHNCIFIENAGKFLIQRTGQSIGILPFNSSFYISPVPSKSSSKIQYRRPGVKIALKTVKIKQRRSKVFKHSDCNFANKIIDQSQMVYRGNHLRNNSPLAKVKTPADLNRLIFDEYLKSTILGGALSKLLENHSKCNYLGLLLANCSLDKRLLSAKVKNLQWLKTALGCYTVHAQVGEFIRQMLRFIIPVQLLGNQANFKKLVQIIRGLILSSLMNASGLKSSASLTRRFKIKHLCGVHRLAVDKIEWLQQVGVNPMYQMQLVYRVIHLIATHCMSVIAMYFYVTEIAGYKMEPFFFRYDLWAAIRDAKISLLCKTDQLLEPIHSSSQDAFNHYKIRFIPKEADLRMICKPLPGFNSMDVNHLQMKEILRLLRFVKFLLTKSLGPNVHLIANQSLLHSTFIKLNEELTNQRATQSDYPSELYDTKEPLMKKFKHNSGVYFVRADIKDCYPTINQRKLYQIICEALDCAELGFRIREQKVHRIQVTRYGKVYTQHDKIYMSSASEYGSSLPKLIAMQYNITNASTKIMNSSAQIIVPLERSSRPDLVELLRLLSDRIFNQIVHIPNPMCYRLKTGIRQGGKLSQELCSIYMSAIARAHLSDFASGPGELLVIHADDLLYISGSEQKATKFLNNITNGMLLQDFGLRLNMDKLRHNLPETEEPYRPNYSASFTYFGYRIELSETKLDINVQPDHSHYFSTNYEKVKPMTYAINMDPMIPISEHCHTLKNIIFLLFSRLLFDERVISPSLAVQNMFRNCLAQGARLAGHISGSPLWKSNQYPVKLCKLVHYTSLGIYFLIARWSKNSGISPCHMSTSWPLIHFILVYALYQWWSRHKLLSWRVKEKTFLRKAYKSTFNVHLTDAERDLLRSEWVTWDEVTLHYISHIIIAR